MMTMILLDLEDLLYVLNTSAKPFLNTCNHMYPSEKFSPSLFIRGNEINFHLSTPVTNFFNSEIFPNYSSLLLI